MDKTQALKVSHGHLDLVYQLHNLSLRHFVFHIEIEYPSS